MVIKLKNICIIIFFFFCLLNCFPQGDISDSVINRESMVTNQIIARGISDIKVINAMLKVKRHLFVPENVINEAYNDYPLRIGDGQTISQPYIVALMTESLNLKGEERVLEIGTGSGYQAAVLSEIVKEVYTIEIKPGLYEKAKETLETLGYSNIQTQYGDGYFGWDFGEHTEFQFDRIMITAAIDHIPPPLLAQLKEGGKMILPLGDPYSYLGQTLVLVTKENDDYLIKQITGVAFVPMTGTALE